MKQMTSLGLDTTDERAFFAGPPSSVSRSRNTENEARAMAGKLLRATTVDNPGAVARCERVATWSRRLGREMGLDVERLLDIELGALLHDIGANSAIAGSPRVLDVEVVPTLTDGEMNELVAFHLHPQRGVDMLASIPELRRAIPLVRAHHERFDGGGFPGALVGEAIPIDARIFHVADAYEGMTAGRSPRRSMNHEQARAQIGNSVGRRFDPAVFEAFCRIPSAEWCGLRERIAA